jgi:predicted nucleic acid-binding protein
MTIPFARMSPLLLDTNVLIDVLRDRNGRADLLKKLARDGYWLMTSTISVAELYAGLRKSEELQTEELLEALECVPVSIEIAQKAGMLRSGLRQIGRTHTLDDMIVAATAFELDCPVLTENKRDFQIEGLTLFPLS